MIILANRYVIVLPYTGSFKRKVIANRKENSKHVLQESHWVPMGLLVGW